MKWLAAVSLLLLLSANYAQIIFSDDEPDDTKLISPGETGDQDVDMQVNTNELNSSSLPETSSYSSCTTPADEKGTCGPYNQCQVYKYLFNEINKTNVLNFFRKRICKIVPRALYICCPNLNLPDLNSSKPISTGETDDQDTDKQQSITDYLDLRSILPGSSSYSSCTTRAGEMGTCRPLNQCQEYPSNSSEISKPDVNSFIKERICRVRMMPGISYDVCCPNLSSPELRDSPQPSPQPQPQPHPSSLIPSESECGQPGVPEVVDVRITQGTKAQHGDWPWLAVLFHIDEQRRLFPKCGGSLITTRHVITAAHCFDSDEDPGMVRLGEHHIGNDHAGERPEDFDIVKPVHIHEHYNFTYKRNDIAIVVLSRDVRFNEYIRAVCLPFYYRDSNFTGQFLTVIGWGKTSAESIVPSRVLLEVKVPVVSQTLCSTKYFGMIAQTQICAGDGGGDACYGDSGGPLQHFDDRSGRYYIVGIVSFGKGCGRPDLPGVYTRVSRFLDWIQQNIQ